MPTHLAAFNPKPQSLYPAPKSRAACPRCQASPIPGITPGQSSQPRRLASRGPPLGEKVPKSPSAYLNLPLAHDLVHDFVVVFVELGLVVALLVAEDAQGLGALQLDLKLLGCGERVAEPQDARAASKLGLEGKGGDHSPLPASHPPLTSFHCGSVVSRKTLVLALLTK